jgi:hypothetical protein
MKTHKIAKRRGSRIFKTIGSQMAVRLSVLSPKRPTFTLKK